jgi:hypothetical protein
MQKLWRNLSLKQYNQLQSLVIGSYFMSKYYKLCLKLFCYQSFPINTHFLLKEKKKNREKKKINVLETRK